MNLHAKPFRLINVEEKQKLEEYFSSRLRMWNQDYGLNAVSLSLELKPKTPEPKGLSQIKIKDSSFLLLNPHETWIQISLFDQDLELPKRLVNRFFCTFLNLLFALDLSHLSLSMAQPPSEEDLTTFFYHGSPLIHLNLRVKTQNLSLYLSPFWVIQCLSSLQAPRISSSLSPLTQALADSKTSWQVLLKPFCLNLGELNQLKVGDVIQSEHGIETPLLLQNEDRLLAQVKLGKSGEYKSIQLES